MLERIIDGVLHVVFVKTGFLPEDGSDEYYNFSWGKEQFGDARDCDTPEEYAACKLHFPDQPLSSHEIHGKVQHPPEEITPA